MLRGHRMRGRRPRGAPVRGRRVPARRPERARPPGRASPASRCSSTTSRRRPSPIHRALAPRAPGAELRGGAAARARAGASACSRCTATEPGRFDRGDVDLLAAVANHVALAIDRAESFQTIEDLSRSLEDKVRVRTEQLRAANEELRERLPRSAGHAAAAHPAREDGLGRPARGRRRPRAEQPHRVHLLQRGHARPTSSSACGPCSRPTRRPTLPEADRARIDARRRELQVDYALRYLDSMISGIREGADRTRKIVGDLRVFTRTPDDVWQAVDLHEELESSLTLLNHLLKDRVTVVRKLRRARPGGVRPLADRPGLPERARQRGPGDRRAPGTITIETAPRRADGGGHHRRHRPRHPARRAPPRLRSVLHHQAGRRGHRARPLDQLRDRHEARRRDPGREPGRRRRGVHPAAAGGPGRQARRDDAGRRPASP